jgi:hypothetical protein
MMRCPLIPTSGVHLSIILLNEVEYLTLTMQPPLSLRPRNFYVNQKKIREKSRPFILHKVFRPLRSNQLKQASINQYELKYRVLIDMDIVTELNKQV